MLDFPCIFQEQAGFPIKASLRLKIGADKILVIYDLWMKA